MKCAPMLCCAQQVHERTTATTALCGNISIHSKQHWQWKSSHVTRRRSRRDAQMTMLDQSLLTRTTPNEDNKKMVDGGRWSRKPRTTAIAMILFYRWNTAAQHEINMLTTLSSVIWWSMSCDQGLNNNPFFFFTRSWPFVLFTQRDRSVWVDGVRFYRFLRVYFIFFILVSRSIQRVNNGVA